MKYFIFMLTFCNIYVIIIKTKIVYENFNKLKSRGELDMRKKILAIALEIGRASCRERVFAIV